MFLKWALGFLLGIAGVIGVFAFEMTRGVPDLVEHIRYSKVFFGLLLLWSGIHIGIFLYRKIGGIKSSGVLLIMMAAFVLMNMMVTELDEQWVMRVMALQVLVCFSLFLGIGSKYLVPPEKVEKAEKRDDLE